MKNRDSLISFVSSLTIVLTLLILVVMFCFTILNIYITNDRILETLGIISTAYTPDANDMPLTAETDPTDGTQPPTSADCDSTANETSSATISALEYSSAIAYLTKIQEVSSANNVASLQALIYTVISTLTITYGAKMLRLGENDKRKLVDEIGVECRKDISLIEKKIEISSTVSSCAAAINSASSLLQSLCIELGNSDSTTLEQINAALMDDLSEMSKQLNCVYKVVQRNRVPSVALDNLRCSFVLLDHHFNVYSQSSVPHQINDKEKASRIMEISQDLFNKIFEAQSRINNSPIETA